MSRALCRHERPRSRVNSRRGQLTRWLAVGTPLPLRKRPGHRFVVNNSLAQRHVDSQWSGDSVGAAQLLSLLQAKRTGSGQQRGPGDVYLVGTGPGDPSLLTLRAVQLMQSADVVLYDRLVSDDILRLVHGGARMVYVGKQAGYHTATQTEIHAMLCQFAEEGNTVVRLKGGDPFIFGRGGEEMQYLEERGINVHTIPGITAGAGICAELGIPMTHRGVATSVRFLTGHARASGEADLDEAVAAAADPHTTLIVYMGLKMLPTLTAQLLAAGMSARTPAVAVERGTTAEQRPVYAGLEDLHDEVTNHQLQSPTLLIIGEVVALSTGWQAAVETGQSLVLPKHRTRGLALSSGDYWAHPASTVSEPAAVFER